MGSGSSAAPAKKEEKRPCDQKCITDGVYAAIYRTILPAILRNRQRSKDIAKNVAERRGKASFKQDPIYHHMGWELLLEAAAPIKQRFDKLITDLATELEANPQLPGLKGERGLIKANTSYGGNVSMLSDIVRGTLEWVVKDGDDEGLQIAIDGMYKAVEMLIDAPNIHVVRFKDRFQAPMSGGYMDLQLLVKVDGFVCELQLNIKSILDIKNSDAGHGQYEEERLANDNLTFAAMKGRPEDFAEKVEKATNLEVRDMYGHRPMHYVASRGEAGMLRQLLSRGASPFSVDNNGGLPIVRPLLLCHKEVVSLLVAEMEIKEVDTQFDGRMLAQLVSEAVEREDRLNAEDGMRLATWAIKQHLRLKADKSLWYLWAEMGHPAVLQTMAQKRTLRELIGEPDSEEVMPICLKKGALSIASIFINEFFSEAAKVELMDRVCIQGRGKHREFLLSLGVEDRLSQTRQLIMDKAMLCRLGHQLETQIETSEVSFRCDECKMPFDVGETKKRCNDCDYDCCLSCLPKRGAKEAYSNEYIVAMTSLKKEFVEPWTFAEEANRDGDAAFIERNFLPSSFWDQISAEVKNDIWTFWLQSLWLKRNFSGLRAASQSRSAPLFRLQVPWSPSDEELAYEEGIHKVCDKDGVSVLHVAAQSGNTEWVAELIDDLPLNIEDDNGQTPLDVSSGAADRLLVHCGAGVKTTTSYVVLGPDIKEREALTKLNKPRCVAQTHDGALLVADSLNHRILQFDPGELEPKVVAGVGGCGDGLDQLDQPCWVAPLDDGGMLVTDSKNHRILKFGHGQTMGTKVAGGSQCGGSGLDQLKQPACAVPTAGGAFLVADWGNGRVLKFEPDSSEAQDVSNVEGIKPRSIAMLEDGGFLVADTQNHAILKFGTGGPEDILILAGSEDGTAALHGELDKLFYPSSVAALPDGSMLVADQRGHRVLKFESGQTKGKVVAGGKFGSGREGLRAPTCVHALANGEFLVVDRDNHRVLHCDVAPVGAQPKIERTGTEAQMSNIFDIIDEGSSGAVSGRQVICKLVQLDSEKHIAKDMEDELQHAGVDVDAKISFDQFVEFLRHKRKIRGSRAENASPSREAIEKLVARARETILKAGRPR